VRSSGLTHRQLEVWDEGVRMMDSRSTEPCWVCRVCERSEWRLPLLVKKRWDLAEEDRRSPKLVIANLPELLTEELCRVCKRSQWRRQGYRSAGPWQTQLHGSFAQTPDKGTRKMRMRAVRAKCMQARWERVAMMQDP